VANAALGAAPAAVPFVFLRSSGKSLRGRAFVIVFFAHYYYLVWLDRSPAQDLLDAALDLATRQ